MDDEARREIIADALRPVLHDGEAYQVVCQDDEVWISEIDSSICAVRYPRLYGRLLSLSAQLSTAAGRVPNMLMMSAAVFSVGLHLEWWDSWLGRNGIDPKKLQSPWFYVLIFFVLIGLLQQFAHKLQWRTYVRRRDEIFKLMKVEDLDRDTLVALLEGDGNVSNVTRFLKIDSEADSH